MCLLFHVALLPTSLQFTSIHIWCEHACLIGCVSVRVLILSQGELLLERVCRIAAFTSDYWNSKDGCDRVSKLVLVFLQVLAQDHWNWRECPLAIPFAEEDVEHTCN